MIIVMLGNDFWLLCFLENVGLVLCLSFQIETTSYCSAVNKKPSFLSLIPLWSNDRTTTKKMSSNKIVLYVIIIIIVWSQLMVYKAYVQSHLVSCRFEHYETHWISYGASHTVPTYCRHEEAGFIYNWALQQDWERASKGITVGEWRRANWW